jgi:hypothetical protein
MRSIILLWFSAWYANYTTSDFVDIVEAQLRANRDSYLSGQRTAARRNAALAYFDQQWAWLHSPAGCGSKLLGEAGKRCLSERTRGSQWPWEAYYRDSIIVGRLLTNADTRSGDPKLLEELARER